MLDTFDLARKPHHQALELGCIQALARGDLATAFRLSDRRCRISPLPDAHSFVLRAEVLHRMGDHGAAVDDLVTALRIAPDDIPTNRRLLQWGPTDQQIGAAQAIVRLDDDRLALQRAIRTLANAGQPSAASLRICAGTIVGWAVWQGDQPPRLRIRYVGHETEINVQSDHRHFLANARTEAGSFVFPVAPSRVALSASVIHGDLAIAMLQLSQRYVDLGSSSEQARWDRASSRGLTIIVPVFADFEATRTCLESLLEELEGPDRRVILVDDASPDPDIRRMLDEYATRGQVRVLRNDYNVGFVGAVNRALTQVTAGDVLLLNSDTILPKGSLGRLAEVARAESDIATVTPLSNNGEFTSFPVPYRFNSLPSASEVSAIDRIAAQINPNGMVEIPNGVGFCLYVTRKSLDAVGFLSEAYQRGYLEDVDFCLRARQQGFRNVCATGVYVGHAGSRSFGRDKRSLVVRNLQVLETRFPDYRQECALFMHRDPLKRARQAIELNLTRPCSPKRLIVATTNENVAIAMARASQMRGEKDQADVLVLEVDTIARPPIVTIKDAAFKAPQSLQFELAPSTRDLASYLRSANVVRVEILDLWAIPTPLIESLIGLQIAIDITLTTVPGLKYSPSSPRKTSAGAVRERHVLRLKRQHRRVLSMVDRIIAPDDEAAEVAALLPASCAVCRLGPVPRRCVTPPRHEPAARLGIVPVRSDRDEFGFVRGLNDCLHNIRPELPVIVLGGTMDDIGLMRGGNVFVTGPIAPDELLTTCKRHQVTKLLIGLTAPLFGHPLLARTAATELPIAAFDWFGRSCFHLAEDLKLDRGWPLRTVARRLVSWLQNDLASSGETC